MSIFKEHWKRYLFIVIVLLSIIISLIFGTTRVITENEQIIYVWGISLENMVSFLTIFSVLSGGLWAMYQYDKNRRIKQQEKASAIAQKFSEELILKITIIDKIIIEFDEIKTILEKIINSNCSNFNIYEMKDILSTKEIKRFKNYIKSQNTNKKYILLLKDLYPDSIIETFPKKFSLLIVQVLNSLEAICMDISTNSAGSQFIYNSLHTCFFKTIQELYIIISSYNKSNVDVLYTNIIDVYKKWNTIKKKDMKTLEKTSKKIIKLKLKQNRLILITKKNIQKLLNKKINRV